MLIIQKFLGFSITTKLRSAGLGLMILLIACACKNKNRYSSAEGYNFNNPEKFKMPSSLLEISGIALFKGDSSYVYSIQDEEGKLFRQRWGIKKQANFRFASGGDYEDLAFFDRKVLVLKSNGHLYTFDRPSFLKDELIKVNEAKGLIPKEEYESIYALEKEKTVYILCKKCDGDKKKKQTTGYRLNYDLDADSFALAGSFTINLDDIPLLNPKLKASLSPSAMAFNDRTQEWFILSSANKLLVVTDSKWKIKEVHKLNSSTFNQPEGIAFDKYHNLYISNEGDEVTDGNVLRFKYQR